MHILVVLSFFRMSSWKLNSSFSSSHYPLILACHATFNFQVLIHLIRLWLILFQLQLSSWTECSTFVSYSQNKMCNSVLCEHYLLPNCVWEKDSTISQTLSFFSRTPSHQINTSLALVTFCLSLCLCSFFLFAGPFIVSLPHFSSSVCLSLSLSTS